MKQITYEPNALSHHNENIQYWVTQGIVIDGERYSIEELFTRSGDLYGVLSKDKITFYEHKLSSNVTQSSYDDKEVKDRISRLETKEIPRYDDTGIQQRITDLENRDNSEISNIKDRLSNIENKEDSDNQTLSINDNTLSISGGNSVTLPNYPKYDDSNVKSRLLVLESKEDKDTIYDDSGIKKRLYDLENKPDKDEQTLTITGNTLSISNGNSVELPKSTEYDDSGLRGRIETLENKPDNDKQTLSFDNDTRILSISNGNNVTIPTATPYDDSDINRRLGVLESKPDNDKQNLSLEGTTLSISNGNSVDIPQTKPVRVSSTSEGVTVTPEEEDGTTNYKVNIDDALSNYYDKSKTYTKDEVSNLISKQEDKATDITVYRGTFRDKTKVKEGAREADISPRITLTYSSSTGVGILKIDFIIVDKVYQNYIIAELPADAPVPAEFIESQVWIGEVNTSIWVDKGGRFLKIVTTTDPRIFNKRIILNIPGIFKKH